MPAERVWDGALWALITSAFVHIAVWHLLFNLYWMGHLGSAVERELGSFKYLVLVLALAFVSSAWQLAVSNDTGIGASGVVYGLLGFMWRSKEQGPRYAAVLGSETAALFIIWLVACLVATHAGFANIGNAAHIAGLSLGVLIAEWRIRGRYSTWAFHNLALAYYSMGDSTQCAGALRRLRATAPAEADSLGRRLLSADFSPAGSH